VTRAVVALMAAAAGVAGAQTFEVATIKPSDPTAQGSSVGIAPGGIFRARNVTLKRLMQQVYDVRGYQILGGPAWLGTQGYDIQAKGNGPAVSEEDLAKMTNAERDQFQVQMIARVRALLEDRFQLKVHRETKEMPIYSLVAAKGGPKLTARTEPSGRDGFNVRGGSGKDASTLDVTGTRVRMSSLVRFLSEQVERPVVDKTGLTGDYDFKMNFVPGLADADGPSVFTALQEQLGLRLESQKGPVEMVVIDGVEKASEN